MGRIMIILTLHHKVVYIYRIRYLARRWHGSSVSYKASFFRLFVLSCRDKPQTYESDITHSIVGTAVQSRLSQTAI